MGLFSEAKAQLNAQKANRAHVAGNEAASAGRLEEAREKYRQAYSHYEAAVKDDPQKAAIHQSFAILLMRLGEFDRAKAIMERIRLMKNLTPDDWFELRLNYSVCLWKEGRLDDAIATARRAGQIKRSVALYNTLGMYLVDKAKQTGDFAELEAFNRESMDYDDEDAGLLDNMGGMYEARSLFADDPGPDREKAKEYYARAHKIKPRQITTTYTLARMYHEDGQDDLARKTLEGTEDLYYSAICSVSRDMMEDLKREVGFER